MDSSNLSRKEKILIINDLMSGEKKLADVIDIKVEHLTTSELYLLLNVFSDQRVPKQKRESCKAFYLVESHKRTELPVEGDIVKAVVEEWYKKLQITNLYKSPV